MADPALTLLSSATRAGAIARRLFILDHIPHSLKAVVIAYASEPDADDAALALLGGALTDAGHAASLRGQPELGRELISIGCAMAGIVIWSTPL